MKARLIFKRNWCSQYSEYEYEKESECKTIEVDLPLENEGDGIRLGQWQIVGYEEIKEQKEIKENE